METIITNTKDNMREITYQEYDTHIGYLAQLVKDGALPLTGIYPIPRGGYYPAIKLSQLLNIPIITTLPKNGENYCNNILIVDDIVDSGRTIRMYANKYPTASVFVNGNTTDIYPTFWAQQKGDKYLHFPDEPQDGGVGENIVRILQYIGENPTRQGLVGTPDRIIRMFGEIYRGYDPQKAPTITTFDNGMDGIVYDNMVMDTGDFYSTCEHHMMPFFGKYYFAYIPNPSGKILGISKIGRVVDYCSARLQVQERLVHDIVDTLSNALGDKYPPLGMALVMTGEHLCKTMRGVKKKGTMTSSYLTGLFKEDARLRGEFMSFIK